MTSFNGIQRIVTESVNVRFIPLKSVYVYVRHPPFPFYSVSVEFRQPPFCAALPLQLFGYIMNTAANQPNN